MINPMAMMMQMMKGGGNPQQLMQQMMGNSQIMGNPMVRNAMDMYQKGDMKGLQSMAENLAKERGTTVNEVRDNLMKQFGMK